jgi:hypothetical protein
MAASTTVAMMADTNRREYAKAPATGQCAGTGTNIRAELSGAVNSPASSNAASTYRHLLQRGKLAVGGGGRRRSPVAGWTE